MSVSPQRLQCLYHINDYNGYHFSVSISQACWFSFSPHSMSATDGSKWQASLLTVTILQARRLRPKDRHGGSNPYVQVQLGNHNFTTKTAPNTLYPVWNDAVTFALPTPWNDATMVNLTVMHRRSLAALPDRFLGWAEVRLVDVCRNHQPVCTKWVTDRVSLLRHYVRRYHGYKVQNISMQLIWYY